MTPLSATNNEGYMTAAEGIASRFVSRFASASGCGASDVACGETYLLGLARRAFHGTLESDAGTALKALYEQVRGSVDANAGVEAVVRAILLSPRFLFMIEFGTPSGDNSALTQSEIAGRLAAFIWRSVPDKPLLDLVDSGGLGTPGAIMQQTETMLADARARPMMDDFVLQWLEIADISRVSRDDSAFTPALRDAMEKEVSLIFENAVTNKTTSFSDLLTSSTSYINKDLATLYGATAPATDFAATPMPATRHGILTKGAFLTVLAHPQSPSQVLRGKAVREQFLCDHMQDPPPGVERNITIDSTQTSESAFDAHTSMEPCASCHKLLDPIGHGFAFYDKIGRYSTTENGLALSAQGQINSGQASGLATSPVTGTFNGADELAQLLATTEYVQQCFAVQATRYGLGRDEQSGDACSLKSIWDQFSGGQLSVHQLFVSITGTAAFSHRNTVHAGVSCR